MSDNWGDNQRRILEKSAFLFLIIYTKEEVYLSALGSSYGILRGRGNESWTSFCEKTC